ncbi:carboxypeptidase-like regulatory domain-containing protein [Leptolyngbya sp. 7M]|uniref:carboxypeptidase-like regulatory domain-containing protein n=1 Tax=Leptolyngbya sp. 7M TaxID=2812896 RepID=UPI001B8B0E83|nr:carboxypeptidase-like regulatory domain-containing protein [Leptolyngbya sp. 7M]QYO67220.1 carboxypeptidase-like regulatory domain-containing protein [Leptolyngbya sp. 7M]
MKPKPSPVLFLSFICLIFSLAGTQSSPNIHAQAGGDFDLSHSVIAGGGSASSGGAFRLDGTAGQALAGTLSTGIPPAGNGLRLRGGFWAFDQIGPTSALVSVSGRVTTSGGSGIRNTVLKLTAPDGSITMAQTGSFGNFIFASVQAGQTYILEIIDGRHTFAEPVRMIFVSEEITDLLFVTKTF